MLIVMMGQWASVLPSSVLFEQNCWISLAKSLNLTSLCLQQDTHMHYILDLCVRPAEAVSNLTFFSLFPNKKITYKDLPNWGPSSYFTLKKSVKLFSPSVIIANQSKCVKLIDVQHVSVKIWILLNAPNLRAWLLVMVMYIYH